MQPIPLPCYCGTLRQAARALTQLYDEHLKPSGLRITQFTLLQTIDRIPGIRIADLAVALAMDDTTVTRSIKIMKAAGWVKSVPCDTDKRERTLTLTAPGKRCLAKSQPMWQRAQEVVEHRLSRAAIASSQQTAYGLAAAFQIK